MISVHTSPLAQPGTGDAGGLNVYVVETAREMARSGHRGRHLHPADTGPLDGDVVELARG
jgi:D-inositol-3-phosphate glycosyltransferase